MRMKNIIIIKFIIKLTLIVLSICCLKRNEKVYKDGICDRYEPI